VTGAQLAPSRDIEGTKHQAGIEASLGYAPETSARSPEMRRLLGLAVVLLAAACERTKLDDDTDLELGLDPTSGETDDGGAGGSGSDGSGTDGSGTDGSGTGAADGTGGDAGSGETGGSGDGGAGDGGESSDGEGTGGGGDPADAVLYGDWVARGFVLVEDECIWMESGLDALGLRVDDFLPSDFVVEPNDAGFTIQAWDYGADLAVQCVVDGTEFSCETQSVVPIAFGLGDTGWSYAIDFEGRVAREDSLLGVATVRYSSVDATTAAEVEAAGGIWNGCEQVYEVGIAYGY
jgi:hypothetical protein